MYISNGKVKQILYDLQNFFLKLLFCSSRKAQIDHV